MSRFSPGDLAALDALGAMLDRSADRQRELIDSIRNPFGSMRDTVRVVEAMSDMLATNAHIPSHSIRAENRGTPEAQEARKAAAEAKRLRKRAKFRP